MHVHIYPAFQVEDVFNTGLMQLDKLSSDAGRCALALFLTERYDCHYYKSLRNSRHTGGDNWSIEETAEDCALLLRHRSGRTMFLFAGRQVVTAERLEVLALTADLELEDGLPFAVLHQRVRAQGAIPVLNWAPGKWFFERGRQVQSILGQVPPSELAICDTTLRPTVWREPDLMKRARLRGFHILAGSDPLPYPGEEKFVGSYGVVLEQFDEALPVSSVRTALRSNAKVSIIGERQGLVPVGRRLHRHFSKRREEAWSRAA